MLKRFSSTGSGKARCKSCNTIEYLARLASDSSAGQGEEAQILPASVGWTRTQTCRALGTSNASNPWLSATERTHPW